MKPLDQEIAAKEDIAARPEVTGGEEKAARTAPAAKEAAQALDLAPDGLELSAGKVVSKAVEDLKAVYGMPADKDAAALLSETLGGLFSALRLMSGRPWLRYIVAGGALAFSFIPAMVKFKAAKEAAKNDE